MSRKLLIGNNEATSLLIHVDSRTLTETSTVWTDLSGNNNNFILDGSLDVNENGLLMTSSLVKGGTEVKLNGEFVIEYEVYRTDTVNSVATFSLNQNNSSKYSEGIVVNGNYNIRGYDGDIITNFTTQLNTPYLIRVEYKDDIKMYFDGVLIGTYNKNTFSPNGDYIVYLGSSSYANYPINNSHFRIKSFKLYNQI